MTFNDLDKARRLLGLGERATLREIKSRYRQLAKLHHPDRNFAEKPELIRELNAAHELLVDYCKDYSFSFAEEEFYEQYPDERLRMQFADDPLWGSGR